MQKKNKSDADVKAEIKKLKEMKPNILHYSKFGDDHWAAIDAQLDVLEEGLSDDDIYDRFESDDDDNREASMNVVDSALYASRWRDGDEEESPSNDWKPLVKKG